MGPRSMHVILSEENACRAKEALAFPHRLSMDAGAAGTAQLPQRLLHACG